MNHHAGGFVHAGEGEISRGISAACAGAAFQRDNSPPDRRRRRRFGTACRHRPCCTDRLRHLDRRLRQLLGDAEQVLAPFHLAPDVLGLHAGGCPQDGQVVEQIGALADHRVGLAVDGVDHDFDGFLGELLGHLGRAALKQPRRARRCRIEILGRDHRLIKPLERITHASKLIQTRGERVNARPTIKKIHRPGGRWIASLTVSFYQPAFTCLR